MPRTRAIATAPALMDVRGEVSPALDSSRGQGFTVFVCLYAKGSGGEKSSPKPEPKQDGQQGPHLARQLQRPRGGDGHDDDGKVGDDADGRGQGPHEQAVEARVEQARVEQAHGQAGERVEDDGDDGPRDDEDVEQQAREPRAAQAPEDAPVLQQQRDLGHGLGRAVEDLEGEEELCVGGCRSVWVVHSRGITD